MKKLSTIALAIVIIAINLVTGRQQVTAASLRVPILMYHYIGNNPNPKDLQRNALSISPDRFDAQMAWLAQNGYTPITLDTLWGIFNHQAVAPAKPVVITVDDGYVDFYTNAAPILQKYHFVSVAFIPTGLIGTGYYMNWDQIRQLQHTGLVSFEAHTVTHAYLPKLGQKQMSQELQDSKTILSGQIGIPVNFVAYPYGAVNSAVIQAVQKAGYVGGVGTWFGKATSPSMNLPRIRISGSWSLDTFARRVRG